MGKEVLHFSNFFGAIGCRKGTSTHNVSLVESDMDVDGSKVNGPQTGCTPAETKSHILKHEGEDTYGKGGLSDDERASVDNKDTMGEEQIVYYTPRIAGMKGNGGDKVLFKVSSKDKTEVMEDSNLPHTSPVSLTKENDEAELKRLSMLVNEKSLVESDEDEVAEDDEFSPCRDLFSAHFVKLASDLKVAYSDICFGETLSSSVTWPNEGQIRVLMYL